MHLRIEKERNPRAPGAPRAPKLASLPESTASDVRVSGRDVNLVHVSPCTSLFVSTILDAWTTGQPEIFARDVQIDDRAYRRLDPEYYAWLRSRMNLAKLAAGAGRLSPEAFEELREKFNAVHEWAVAHFGQEALREAIRSLDTRGYTPPTAEDDMPVRPARAADRVAAEAAATIDAIRDQALSLGWTEDLLGVATGSSYEPLSRRCALAHLLRPGDQIGEITPQFIEIVTASGVRQRFYNPDVEQPWIRRA